MFFFCVGTSSSSTKQAVIIIIIIAYIYAHMCIDVQAVVSAMPTKGIRKGRLSNLFIFFFFKPTTTTTAVNTVYQNILCDMCDVVLYAHSKMLHTEGIIEWVFSGDRSAKKGMREVNSRDG